MSKNDVRPISRKANIVMQGVGKEILIYDLSSNKAYSLNETCAMIWQMCDGETTVSQIIDNLAETLNTPITENLVWLALEQLKKDDLLENKSEISPTYSGLSRREVIRRVGLASLVTLPLVSSLIAPMAIHAQSSVCVGACQCPNATVNFCSPAAGGGTIDCNLLSPTATCRCRGPFGASGSGTSPGQKTGSCS
jgi:hypothetical protein